MTPAGRAAAGSWQATRCVTRHIHEQAVIATEAPRVLYEDDGLLVDKPAGVPTQDDSGVGWNTCVSSQALVGLAWLAWLAWPGLTWPGWPGLAWPGLAWWLAWRPWLAGLAWPWVGTGLVDCPRRPTTLARPPARVAAPRRFSWWVPSARQARGRRADPRETCARSTPAARRVMRQMQSPNPNHTLALYLNPALNPSLA